MRVVLDTDVLVAAFVARGVCADLFERVVNHHELVLSPHVLEEFDRTTSKKLGFDPGRVARAMALLRRVGRVVEPVPLAEPTCRDPDDDLVPGLVEASGAGCLVTGDEDLLVLRAFHGVPILSPREFLVLDARRDAGPPSSG